MTNIQGYDYILTEGIISCCIIDFHKTNFRIMHFVLGFNVAFINVFNEFPKMGLVLYIKYLFIVVRILYSMHGKQLL